MSTEVIGLTPEQLAIRKHGIGGSEIAAVAGLSPWAGPLDVYLEKTGQTEDKDNSNMERGRFLEDGLRQWFTFRTGQAVRKATTLVHPEHPIVIATPDGIVHDDMVDLGVLELKSPQWTADHWGNEGTDQIPPYYIPQVQWEMACTGLKKAWVAALLHGNLSVYLVKWDEELFTDLVSLAEDFWTSYVVPRVPPSPEGSAKAIEYMQKRFERARPKDLIATNDDVDKLTFEYRTALAELSNAERKRDGLKAQLMERIGEHEGIVGEWGKMMWTNMKGRVSIDWETIAREHGATAADIEAHTKVGTGGRTFRCYFKGEE
jgi:putative phage-type endonuclease